MKILFINQLYGVGSTGKIVQTLGEYFQNNGHKVFYIYGFGKKINKDNFLKIIPFKSIRYQKIKLIKAAITGKFGFDNNFGTKKAINYIKKIKPDIINVHILHGGYINAKMLIENIKELKIPLLLTQHDCWNFTGHCAHFINFECTKWKTECQKCSFFKKTLYPRSFFFDKSKLQFLYKKNMFNYEKLIVISPSRWLTDLTKKSKIFEGANAITINNGIDFCDFLEDRKKYTKFIIVSTAPKWTESKGFYSIIDLAKKIDSNIFEIHLFGEIENPSSFPNVVFFGKVSKEKLISEYQASNIFINLSNEDTYPTVNIEALQCGLPIIAFNTCGTAEICDEKNAFSIKAGDIESVIEKLLYIYKNPLSRESIINYGKRFSSRNMGEQYLKIAESLNKSSFQK